MPALVVVPILMLAALWLALYGQQLAIVLQPILEGMADRVPVIGRYIKQGTRAVLNYVTEVVDRWIDRLIAPVIDWFTGVAHTIRELPEEVAAFATRTKAALEYLALEYVPGRIEAATLPLGRGIDAVDKLLERTREELAAFRQGIEGRTRQLTELVWTRAIEPLTQLELDLARFRNGIEGRVRDLTDLVWERAIGPVADVIGRELPALRGRVGQLERALSEPLAWLLGLMAAVSLADAIAGIRAARRAERKLDRMCTLDLDEVEDLFGFAFAALSIAAIVEIVREGQVIAEAHARIIEEVIGD